MLSLRFKRVGKRNRPYYRLVVADARSPRDGKCIEELGAYDPYKTTDEEKISLNKDRINYWLKEGAKVSTTVKNFFKKQGISC